MHFKISLIFFQFIAFSYGNSNFKRNKWNFDKTKSYKHIMLHV